MECRVGCGACCIEISISSPIPGMPEGKPAGIRCIHLSDGRCGLFGDVSRPKICSDFPAMRDICGLSKAEAEKLIREMELATS